MKLTFQRKDTEMGRTKLEGDRKGIVHKGVACGFEYFITINFYDGTPHRPAEMFITISKQGSIIAGFAKALFVLMSVSLQYGMPWEVVYNKLSGMKFDPFDDEHSSLVSAMVEDINNIVTLFNKENV